MSYLAVKKTLVRSTLRFVTNFVKTVSVKFYLYIEELGVKFVLDFFS